MPTHNHGDTTANGGHSHDRGSMNITGSQRFSSKRFPNGITDSGSAIYTSATSTDGYFSTGSDSASGVTTINLNASRSWAGVTSTVDNHQHTTQDAGSGQSHNNMQPYLAVAIWKRTA